MTPRHSQNTCPSLSDLDSRNAWANLRQYWELVSLCTFEPTQLAGEACRWPGARWAETHLGWVYSAGSSRVPAATRDRKRSRLIFSWAAPVGVSQTLQQACKCARCLFFLKPVQVYLDAVELQDSETTEDILSYIITLFSFFYT